MKKVNAYSIGIGLAVLMHQFIFKHSLSLKTLTLC